MRSAPTRPDAASSTPAVPPPVLILCADDGVAEGLVRELASRCYQPLIGRPDWSWRATLEWARPVAAVVDREHPAARSAGFLDASDDLEVALVVFGGPVDVPPGRRRNGSRAELALVPTAD